MPDSGGDQQSERTTVLCPSCGSKLTRRSMRRSWKDRLKGAFGRMPYRCQMCNMRFTVHQDPDAIARHNAGTEEYLRQREVEERNLAEAAEEEGKTHEK